MIECQECGQAFQNSGAFRMHKLWKHEKSQALSQGKSELNDLNSLKPEKSLEIEEAKPEKEEYQFSCVECGKEFNDMEYGFWDGSARCPYCEVKLDI